MDDLGEEEDVVIKGSELHRALANVGYADVELTLVDKNNVMANELITRKYRVFKIFSNLFTNCHPFNSIFNYIPKIHRSSSQHFQTIMQAESLLDDHAALVESFLEKNSPTFWKKFTEWSSYLVSSAMIVIGYSMFKRKKTFAMFISISIAAFTVHCKHKEYQAVRALKDLVSIQNELYHLYKRSLGVLRNVYHIRIDGKKVPTKFSKLEADRLKYLQPFTEIFLNSMENVSRTYYRASSMIVDLLPKSSLENHTITHFETDEFEIEGEITYEKFKRLYYVYILVQSDIMQILAIAYDFDTRIEQKSISYSLLTCIIVKLCDSLKNEMNRLVNITREYENRKRKTIERKFGHTSISKWRDLYINLELMSRKLQTVYDEINSILETIEKHENDERTEGAFITELATRSQDVYSQIDKSRNFAEFNNLLIAALQRSRKTVDTEIPEMDSSVNEPEDNQSIMRDYEPQIIDEVFEEYITEEYLKPLYEESDEATMDIAKFDKLLAKNFMCELKEALVEKYKSMSKREADALLRKYRGTVECSKCEDDCGRSVDTKNHSEKSIIPCPPPLPRNVGIVEKSSLTHLPRQKTGFRGPVPLPRSKNDRPVTHQYESHQTNVFVPPPPPPPMPPTGNVQDFENIERFSIDLPNRSNRKMPAFMMFTEEFIGSGENSEEEIEECDKDDDEL